MDTKRKIKRIVDILEARKGEDIEILYVGRQTWIADYFVIVSGNSIVHTRALADTLLGEFGEKAVSVEGMGEGSWILLDYAEILVHIFVPETRSLYNLEKLWADV